MDFVAALMALSVQALAARPASILMLIVQEVHRTFANFKARKKFIKIF